jgi:hypothetical protein
LSVSWDQCRACGVGRQGPIDSRGRLVCLSGLVVPLVHVYHYHLAPVPHSTNYFCPILPYRATSRGRQVRLRRLFRPWALDHASCIASFACRFRGTEGHRDNFCSCDLRSAYRAGQARRGLPQRGTFRSCKIVGVNFTIATTSASLLVSRSACWIARYAREGLRRSGSFTDCQCGFTSAYFRWRICPVSSFENVVFH